MRPVGVVDDVVDVVARDDRPVRVAADRFLGAALFHREDYCIGGQPSDLHLPWIPQRCALPDSSARWARITATSGSIGATA